MSEGSQTPPEPIRNQTWLHSEPAARSIRRLTEPVTTVAERIIAGTLISIEARTRRALDYSDDSANEPELPTHVVTERHLTFRVDNYSLLPQPRVRRRAPSRSNSTVSNASARGEFSLTSYESDVFDPNELDSDMDRQTGRRTPNITDELVEDEINRMRTRIQQPPEMDVANAQPGSSHRREPDSSVIDDLYAQIRSLSAQFTAMSQLLPLAQRPSLEPTNNQSRHETVDYWYPNGSRGNTRDPPGRPGVPLDDTFEPVTPAFRSRLREARDLIPPFDGSSEEKLREFLNACVYAFEIIHPTEEYELTKAIKHTKLRGPVVTELANIQVNTYSQLKQALETCYSRKPSTIRLQRDFHFARQKNGEDARTFGQRIESLATELFNSSTDGTSYDIKEKRAIQEYIKSQALVTFLLGLSEPIQTIVRSRAPATLAEAIAGAIEEERVKGPLTNNRDNVFNNRPRSYPINKEERTIKCLKCGKLGHTGRECRSSRYANKFTLPKPDRANVNATDKFCSHCKIPGHTRAECWSAPGNNNNRRSTKPAENRETTRTSRSNNGNNRNTNTITKAIEHSETEENGTINKMRTVRDFQVNLVKRSRQTGLDLIILPMTETRKGEIPLLLDTGSAISFVKLRNLAQSTPLIEEALTITGVTGHQACTIGRFEATIRLGRRSLTHDFYIIRNDFPIDYEGILGVDFLQAHNAKCNYENRELKLAGTTLKLLPFYTYKLPARSETVIQATTNTNAIGIVNAEETRPGILIANCLVEADGYMCAISVLNTTDETIEIITPYVTIEQLPEEKTTHVYAIKENKQSKLVRPRLEKLREQLRLEHLNKEEYKAIYNICEEFTDVFFLEGDLLTYATAVEHQITTRSDSAPVNVKPYRLPEKHKQEVNSQVQEMLTNKIIRTSASQWNAPLLVVPKKTDATGKAKLRVVVDFRKLNDLTIGDSFPIPNINDILDQLGNAKYFTTLDLASGYHQILMSQEDRQKTAFSTPTGHFEFNRMPFGLKNAPATFQRLMNTVLTGLQGLKCLVYLDDIVIYGSSLEDHTKKLITVLDRLRQHNLKLQPNKCEFLRKEVAYLGHIISEHGILPDSGKSRAIQDFPVPKNVKDIQSFIGLAGYYRRFIENFSKIARPLTKMTKKDEKFVWGAEQENALVTLKEKLTTAPVLAYPDFAKEFIVTTDASDYAIGTILSQGPIGRDHPIAYASRVLNKAEQNYNTTEKELLAIVWAVKHFRPYIYGTRFKIVTDHKPLVWLFNVTDPGSRLIRWRLKLEEYDYEIIHKAGRANTNADALSRGVTRPIMQTKADKNEKENTDSSEDELSDYRETKDIETRDYTKDEKQRILYEYHNSPLGGHQGVQRTLKRIRLAHKWKNMTADIAKYISKCESCQKNKLSRRNKQPLVITDTPHYPMEKCALDIVGPLTITENGNKYILTFQDNLTKFSKAIPIPDQEAATIARQFVEKIVLEYGIPDKVLTDQGTNFLSNMFKQTCKLLKIEKIQTTAYHPQSNGALERSHRTLAEYLRHYINEDQTNWDEWMPYAIFTYNTTPHTSTNYTPFELMYGRQAILPSAINQSPKPTYTFDDYAQEMKQRLRAANGTAREQLKREKQKSKKYYDQKTKNTQFHVGDKVLLYDETVRRGRSKKLDSLWIGPYEIIKKHSDVNYTIKKGRRELRVHANRLKYFIDN